ncbi:MAG: hypothetical protein GY697_21235 [Desulfobacterales bacterium]|nr:hypothetical protein [Desulfobacterales bacterium]
MTKLDPIDLAKLKTYPLDSRKSKVSVEDFATPWTRGMDFSAFLDSLPSLLAAGDLNAVIDAIVTAVRAQKTIVMGMGAHVIKVGLNPLIIDLMQRRVLTALAMNGAGIIHDLELAMQGQTSEDVAASLGDGSFGMARETGEFLSRAIKTAGEKKLGLGAAVGAAILAADFPYKDKSLLAACTRLNIPVTVHVAMGTDIIHMHPDFDPAAAGAASHRDFRLFAAVIATLEKGVYLNVGSAVIMPEVFLKATTLVRNLGSRLADFTTVNMDFIKHYRPMTNVVHRPTSSGGKGYSLVGHHEIMLPLVAAGILEQLEC